MINTTISISLFEIFMILLLHFIADFYSQTDKEANNKSKSNKYLLKHTLKYTLTWSILVFWLSFIPSEYSVTTENLHLYGAFLGITFVCHTIQDYITSRVNKRLLPNVELIEETESHIVEKKNKPYSTHRFFIGIGLDQMLHYIQLFGTYIMLFKL